MICLNRYLFNNYNIFKTIFTCDLLLVIIIIIIIIIIISSCLL